jgi:hypothetical protein
MAACPAKRRGAGLRKLAFASLKEKHYIPKFGHAIRSKVTLLPVFILLMKLVFISRGRQFLSKIPMSVAISGAFFCSLDFLLHCFIKKKVEEEITSAVPKKFKGFQSGSRLAE